MANLLDMATIQTILTLRQLGWSQRRIADHLGIHRDTVARYLAQAESAAKPAKAPLGSADQADSKPAKAPLGSADQTDSKPAKAPLGTDALAAREKDQEPGALGGSPQPLAVPSRADQQSGLSSSVPASVATLGDSLPTNSVSTPPAATGAPCPGEEKEREDGAGLTAGCWCCSGPGGEKAGGPAVGLTTGPSRSVCEPFRAVITAKLEQGLSAQRIYQDLVGAQQFTGSYYSVRRFVGRLAPGRELPFRRLECAPGAEVQVDFGQGAPLVTADGKRRRPHVFRLVLSHSRKGYSEAVDRQTTENFVRCLENAFWHFGGVPETVVLDNLKAAVTKADWFDPELNPKLQAFAEHYGVALLPTRPYTPRHKGKIERGVGYVQDNGLKGHTFTSLAEQNRHLAAWEKTVADTRLHGTTRQQVGRVFVEVERPWLRPLPAERFPFFHEGQRRVHRDGHVEVAKAYYSVPPEYLGRDVWVRWDGRVVRLFNQRWEQIAVHAQQAAGRFSTHQQHLAAEKISTVERGANWLLTKVRRIGPHTTRWAEAMVQARGIEGVRVLQGLLSLAKRYASEALEKACDLAWSHGAYQLRNVRALLERQGARQESMAFLEEHPLIRPLTDYSALIHKALHQEPPS